MGSIPTSTAMDSDERNREYQRRDRAQRKTAVLTAYGNVCVCCGESEPSFLVIDHVNNDGARHREKIGQGARKIGSGSIMHKWLMANNYPEGVSNSLCK